MEPCEDMVQVQLVTLQLGFVSPGLRMLCGQHGHTCPLAAWSQSCGFGGFFCFLFFLITSKLFVSMYYIWG